MYQLIFSAAYDRLYRKLTPELQRKTDATIQQLLLDPRLPLLHTHKREGRTPERVHPLYFSLLQSLPPKKT